MAPSNVGMSIASHSTRVIVSSRPSFRPCNTSGGISARRIAPLRRGFSLVEYLFGCIFYRSLVTMSAISITCLQGGIIVALQERGIRRFPVRRITYRTREMLCNFEFSVLLF